MPRNFDNIELKRLPIIGQDSETAHRADFYVGYSNLRGWKLIDSLIAP